MVSIKTFVFLDEETTGLPSFEHKQTKITELCLTAIDTQLVCDGVYPRVQNKLVLCFKPGTRPISKKASKMSGLTNDSLAQQQEFDGKTVNILTEFLGLHPEPICFVAHNGRCFDFPILRSEILEAGGALPESILYVDSKVAFKSLVGNRSPGYSLEDLYKTLTGKAYENAHQAENDVRMLIECAVKLGREFVLWSNNNAEQFSSIPPLRMEKL